MDTDYDGWELADGTWDEQRMHALLSRHPDVLVSGTVENQGRLYDRLQHVVLLSAPVHVLLDRVRRRTNNPYGRSDEQQAEIVHFTGTIEPLLRNGSTLELDGRRPVAALADAVERLIAPMP